MNENIEKKLEEETLTDNAQAPQDTQTEPADQEQAPQRTEIPCRYPYRKVDAYKRHPHDCGYG